ncbi:MAG: hypothetical protein AAGF56_12150, partial [Pseudomonadota bacterium]
MADALIGPLALAFLPIALLVWDAFGASVGALILLVILPTLAILAALADRHLRRNLAASNMNKIENAADSFEIALRAALYRARLRRGSVICMIIELNAPA